MQRYDVILSQIERVKVATFVTDVSRQTMQCRAEHHCGILPFEYGAIITALAASIGHHRILELGTALGFSTLCLANGAKRAVIETIESDPVHVAKAAANFVAFGCADRITIHEATFEQVLPALQPSYDMAMFDGWSPKLAYLSEFERLLRKGGVLVSSNLLYGIDEAEISEAVDYGLQLFCRKALWHSVMLDGNTVVSVRL